jgi:hypothetical protein
VSWSYFNGNDWVEFTPESGPYHLDQNTQQVRLWIDSTTAPANWQKCEVNGTTRYWIKVEVVTAYTAGPIGSQLTPLGSPAYLTS